jgi:hypothetical protein
MVGEKTVVVLSQHSCGQTEENHEQLLQEYTVFEAAFIG